MKIYYLLKNAAGLLIIKIDKYKALKKNMRFAELKMHRLYNLVQDWPSGCFVYKIASIH
jgi:uncharacterized membrane protein YsdA (DUF1294 family)